METLNEEYRNDIVAPRSNHIYYLLQLMRMKQWCKNVFVFSVILTSSFSFHDWDTLFRLLSAFALFCFISSTVYIMNDLFDIEQDKIHPIKRLRPLPSGHIGVKPVIIFVFILLISTLSMSFILDRNFGYIVSGYFVLNLLYSLKLKEFMLIDIMAISAGFILRTVSGSILLGSDISFRLVLSIGFLTLFIGLNKRKREIISMQEKSVIHRKTLGKYSVELINEIIPVTISCAMISYSFYVMNEASSPYMVATIPIVLYGIFRYQYLVKIKECGENPESVLLMDKPIILVILLWGFVFIISRTLSGHFIL